ncbi:MAG: hypothetical protein MI863_09790 [Desulfobacterales bacterium]|nr:hypothetical protein [Desulfobacterales bacterium]
MAQKAKISDNKAICQHCDTRMVLIRMNRYQGKWPWALLGLGFLAFWFIHFGGPVIGVPMMIFGVYLLTVKQTISMCPECGYHFQVLIRKREAAD